jgi:hypothetical protein
MVFSKIDLRKGYYQITICIRPAICTPFGLFEFRRMPFGLRNAGNTFQRMIDWILAGLSFVFCYLDDIIIASRDQQEHLEHLREVFYRLRDVGLVINAEKCVFAETAIKFLGHKVSAAGVEPLRSHVLAVLAHPEPTNISELQAFLGTVNFYRGSFQQWPGYSSRSRTCSLAPRRGRSQSAWPTRSEPLLWRPRMPWQWPRACHTLPRVSSSASWWMLWLTTSAAPCSKGGGRLTLGNSSSVFSPGSWTAPR